MADNKIERPMEILGVEGAKISNGFVHDEFLIKLVGERGRRVYREMRDNDSVVSAILFAVEMLLRAVDWTISCDSEDDSAAEGVEFLEGVLDDMSHTWDDFISNVTSMLLAFGWQYSEVVYKRRLGPDQRDPRRRSKFSDGKIGIRKIGDRSQETLNKWEIDEDDGSVLGMWQDKPNGGGTVFIPIERALLFRPHMHKGSPEGRSVLRGAYRSWFMLKNIQEIEAIAIERELNGLPVVYIPNATLNGESNEAIAATEAYKKLVRDIKFNEQGGVVLPSDPYYDADGKPSSIRQVELQLLNAKGSRAINTDSVIKRYQSDIARTILADFIMLGQGDRGSFALSRSKVDLFARALEGWLSSIASTCNRHLVPKLWRLNGFDPGSMPYLVPGRVAPEDLKELGDYVESLSRAGIVVTDAETEDRLRDAGGLPEAPVDEDGEGSTIPREEEPEPEPTLPEPGAEEDVTE